MLSALYQYENKTRDEYVSNIVYAINTFYSVDYRKSLKDNGNHGLFKAVISSTTPSTGKTISTLAHVTNLDLTQYKNILILDNEADAIWCKHDMMELKRYKVNVALIEVSPLEIWIEVFRRFRAMSILYKADNRTKVFYNLIEDIQQTDHLFLKFRTFLEVFHKNDARENLDDFAVPIPNQKVDVLRKYNG